jgi:ligand-binding sensor domain-containing protein
MHSSRFMILFFFTLISNVVPAQQFVNGFKRFGSAEGVPNSSSNKIFESSDHFLWLSTESGLYRFDGYQFTPYFSKRNDSTTLSSSVIGDIEEDRLGNLWVSTFGRGVNKLNRKTGKWKQYPHPTPDEHWHYWVFDLFKDSQGRLWLGTNGRGLLLYDEKTDNFLQYLPDNPKNIKAGFLDSNQIRSIAADAANPDILWLAGINSFYRFDTKSKNFIGYKNIKNGKFEGINNSFHTIHVQDAANIWLGTWAGGLVHFNIQTKQFTNYPPVPQEYAKQNFSRNIINDIAYCSDTSLYVSSFEGLFEFNHQQKKFVLLNATQTQDKKNAGRLFNGITHTSDGSTWICSPGNIFQKNPVYERMGTFQSFYQPKGKFLYPPELYSVLYRKETKQFWMSCNSGYGIYIYDSSFRYIRSIAIEGNAVDRQLRDIVEDALGNIWLRSRDAPYLYYYDKAKGRFLNAASKYKDASFIGSGFIKMATDSKGNVWFVNNQQLIKWEPAKNKLQVINTKYYGSNKILDNWKRVRLVFDTGDNPWLATYNGLHHYNQQTKVWQHLYPEEKNNQSLANTEVQGIALDGAGNCWLTPRDEGLQVYNPGTKKFIKHYTQSDGFIAQRAFDVVTDLKGDIWVVTVNGLARYNIKTWQWTVYNKEDGLLEGTYYESLFMMPDGTMIFAAQDGFIHWNINSFPVNKQKPVVYFNRFVSGGKELSVENNSIHLPSSTNEITIDFSAIASVMSNRTKFYYKILPRQKEWVATTQRSISLAAITPGEFTLLIKAVNPDGIESEVKQITISVAFPFWKTGWFKILCLLITAGIIYAFSKWRGNTIRKEEKRKILFTRQMAEMEMKALRSQMNPHFIFNCINSIDALIQSNDKYSATVYLNKFAKLIRNILDSSKQNTVTLAKDLDTLKLYIELEQLRHENKFTAEIKADDALLQDDYKVPPLIIQPFVENAILHGIRYRPDNKGKLSISVIKQNDFLKYSIEDNGVGRNTFKSPEQKEKISYGIDMSNERVKLFNNEEKASVLIVDLFELDKPAGTRVEVLLKIQ